MFITLFATVSIILMINLLIAIMSDTYAKFSEKKGPLYLADITKLRERFDTSNHRWSCLVSSPTPFNLLLIPLIPLIILGSKSFNRAVLFFQYLPVAIVSICGFSIITICLIPFSYLAAMINKFVLVLKCRL